MQKYYVVAQSDTDENGKLVYPNRLFTDGAGVPQLYISAEEAREEIARDVANCCAMGTRFAINDTAEYTEKSWTDAYQRVIKEMKPEDGQYVVVMFHDSTERNYTVCEVMV
jgi:hypothetical protein